MGKFLLVVVAFAALVYLVFWWLERRRVRRQGGSGGRSVGPSRPRGPQKPPRIQGPDDDPDFLRRLEQQRRRDARRRAQGEGPAEGDSAPGSV